jgi:guanylate kinase
MQVKTACPGAVSIFILPPSAQEVRRRLINRKSETPEQIEQRMLKSKEQMHLADTYDYVVMNDNLEVAVQDVVHIISAVRRRTMLHKKLIDQISATFE